MNSIQNFTIFGERNSGTNYLKNTLEKILYLKFTQEYGYKHWFIKNVKPRGITNTTTDLEQLKSINDNEDTLFIVIVRNPYDWCSSMYKKPYHIKKNIEKNNLYDFIKDKYVCYEDKKKNSYWKYNKDNKYPYFIEEAKNLVELRNLKNQHFFNLRKYVKHYYLIRQDNLFKDIYGMIKKFNLKFKSINISKYRKPTKYMIDYKSFKFIKDNINNEIDNKLYKQKSI